MEKHLKATYGFNKFRPYQQDIINDLLNGENVFAILPTGGGKSLLYQFPATYTNKITIVVSPLISLMNDQCIYLNSKNIKSICLNSETRIDVSEYKNYKIIYATPEFITSRIHVLQLIKDTIGLFAIDESHCVSQWSHDFRESYLVLGIIKTTYPTVPLLAVTATATPRVVDDIYNLLNITDVNEYSLGTRRTNLEISILPKKQFDSCEFNEPTIIYVQTRKICESLYKQLQANGIKTAHYHGGMPKKEKSHSHNLFARGDIMVIVATISFGMGIDKSNIRHVINYGVPNDLETYYQEIGRAGRDGLPSKATLYYNPQDFSVVMFLINLSLVEKQVKIKTQAMHTFRKYLEENNICRQQIIDYYFKCGDFPTEKDVINIPKCNMCDNCKGNKKQALVDISEETKAITKTIYNQYNKNGFTFGMKKTIDIIKQTNSTLFHNRSNVWVRELLEILITKNILIRIHKKFGFIIMVGDKNISSLTPIMVRINNDISIKFKDTTIITNEMKLIKLKEIRKRIAESHSLIPSGFINDRVILNIHEKKPKNIGELWAVDGISNEFIMMYGDEFMKEYNKITSTEKKITIMGKKITSIDKKNNINLSTVNTNLSDINANILIDKLKKYRLTKAKESDISPFCIYHNSVINEVVSKCPVNKQDLLKIKGLGKVKVKKYGEAINNMCVEILNKNRKDNKDIIFKLYKEGKNIKEIAKITSKNQQTIEDTILYIFEYYEDVDIDMDYFGLSEEHEQEIKCAVKRGITYIDSIKKIINKNISYAQIKLCLLVIKIEGK